MNKNELIKTKLREEALLYICSNEPDIYKFLQIFGRIAIDITKCDQIIFQETNGNRIIVNSDDTKDITQNICSNCPFSKLDSNIYQDGFVLLNKCSEGFNGIMPHPKCPAKSSYMQEVYFEGKVVGLISFHYLKNLHTFNIDDIEIIKILSSYLGLLVGRMNAKKAEYDKVIAESNNKSKTEFLFNMSHDIRTPMNAILGFTDIGLRHLDDIDKVKNALTKIKLSGRHLLNLINDILEMSRIESGKLTLSYSPLDIRDLLDNVVQMAQALSIPKSIDLNVDIKNIKNPYILADELHLNEILINIISNAIKYTPEGGKVYFSVEDDEEKYGIVNYKFIVSDTGIGMSEEFLKHLFESFSREETDLVSKQEGAGLGLAIVKKIIDLSCGTINVESSVGVGSTFTVILPIKVIDEAVIEELKAKQTNFFDSDEVKVLLNKRVLIVEDNLINREIAVEILEEAGLICDTSEDGLVALNTIKEKGVIHYDFILMDIQMPVMNGYEATKAIRKLPLGTYVPIIALSANAFKEDIDKSLSAGMNAHVSKPIDITNLLSVMTKLTK